MVVTGIYRIALLPGADEPGSVRHLTQVAFGDVNLLQLTRITRGFQHRLVKARGEFPQFLWIVQVDLVTDAGYHFAENVERIQQALGRFGVVTGLETGETVAEG